MKCLQWLTIWLTILSGFAYADCVMTRTTTGEQHCVDPTSLGVLDPSVDDTVPIANGVTIDMKSIPDCLTSGFALQYNASTNTLSCANVAGAGSSSTLLDGTVHTDTVAQTVSRGSLIYGNSTPKWDELVIGSANKVLHSDGTDASWQSLVDADIPNNITIDLATAASALAANGTNCSAGSFPLGVDASGNSESCTALSSSNAGTATALAANPADCSAGQYATTIAANGDLTCAQVATNQLSGSVTDAQVPDTITINGTGNVSVASIADFGDDKVLVGSGAGNAAKTIPNCTDSGGSHLNYDQSTNTISCGTTTGSGSAHQLLSASHSDTVSHTVVLGDLIFGNATPAWAALAGQTTTNKEYLSQTGNGSVSATPAWAQIAFGDVTGSVTDSQVPDTITINGTGNVSTASVANLGDNNLLLGGSTTNTTPTVPACADSGGNHLNYSSHGFTCGTTDSGTASGAVTFSGVISPSSIGSDQNDWAPTGLDATTFTIRITSSANVSITGISASAASASQGRLIALMNIGTHNVTLTDLDSGSSSANQFRTGQTLILKPNNAVWIEYDGTSTKWQIFSPKVKLTGTGSVGSECSDDQVHVSDGTNDQCVTLPSNQTSTTGSANFQDTAYNKATNTFTGKEVAGDPIFGTRQVTCEIGSVNGTTFSASGQTSGTKSCGATGTSPVKTAKPDLDTTNHREFIECKTKVSTPTTGDLCSVQITDTGDMWSLQNPRFEGWIITDSALTNTTIYVGFADNGGPVPNFTTTTAGVADTSDMALFVYDTAGGTGGSTADWWYCTSNSTTRTCFDTGATVSASTMYAISIYTADNGTTWVFNINGTEYSTTTTVPLANSAHILTAYIAVRTRTGAQKLLNMGPYGERWN